MGNDEHYIYGDSNGATYTDGREGSVERKTHWDPRVEVSHFAGRSVQVGVVPPSAEHSTDASGVWDRADGQFLSLDRDGLNRLIRALQEAGVACFGRDAW